jgi:hypothetical protein
MEVVAATDERQFPILSPLNGFTSVPLAMVEPFEKRARNNHGQSLSMLARRGGLSYDELLAVLEDRDLLPSFKRDPQAALKVHTLMLKWRERQKR